MQSLWCDSFTAFWMLAALKQCLKIAFCLRNSAANYIPWHYVAADNATSSLGIRHPVLLLCNDKERSRKTSYRLERWFARHLGL
jgi:hypothetical protein